MSIHKAVADVRTRRKVIAVTVICLLTLGAAGYFLMLRSRDGTAMPPSADRLLERIRGDREWLERSCSLPFDYLRRIRRGYFEGRSPEIIYVPREVHEPGGMTVVAHSGPWPATQRIPLILYGRGHVRKRGLIELQREVTLADIASTIESLLRMRFPKERDGSPVTQALRRDTLKRPRLIVVLVWDGAGINVLNEWPRAWPYLRSVVQQGTAIRGATVGSSPSNTPPAHTTIGTGVFPMTHGVVDLVQRDGDEVVDPFALPALGSPENIVVPTLADLYDRALDNKPKVGMLGHLSQIGMIGHGSYLDGGDKDIAVFVKDEWSSGPRPVLYTNDEFFSLPDRLSEVGNFNIYKRQVDAADGTQDGEWLGNQLDDDLEGLLATPAWTLYQNDLVKQMILDGNFGGDNVPDLLFINFKQIDAAGHSWGFMQPEMKSVLEYSDGSLRQIHSFLDRQVGPKNYVLVLTADHGQLLPEWQIGAWALQLDELQEDVSAFLSASPEDVFDEDRPGGLWVRETWRGPRILEAIAQYLANYSLSQNLPNDPEARRPFEERVDEPMFSAAFPSTRLDDVWDCAVERKKARAGRGG